MLKDGAQFSLHRTREINRGSKLLTALFALIVIGVPGAGYYLYSDTPALVRHATERDALATISLKMLAIKGAAPEQADMLVAALNDTSMSPTFRAAAAEAIGGLKDTELTRILGAAVQEDSSPTVRAAALRALGVAGDQRAERYVAYAFDNDADDDVQQAASEAVGKLEFHRLLPTVIDLLKHKNPAVRNEALRVLETFTGENETYNLEAGAWLRWYEETY